MTTLQQTMPTEELVKRKLPREQEHYEALQRMNAMLPYYRWVADSFGPALGNRVLDAGCGVGNFFSAVTDRVELGVGIDLSPVNVADACNRFADHDNIRFIQADLDEQAQALRDERFDTVVCLDVLEHIEDDAKLLTRLAQIVEPGGHVLIKVPACPWLYGSVDVASDHFRRYTRPMLRRIANLAGLEVVRLRYMNLAGVGPYFIKSRVLKKQANFSRTFSPKQLDRIRRMMPWLRRLDRVTGPPVGQSLVMVGRRPTA
jgi:2-polyprenyl-3-methyl-5-hydroxy-6-metoxy-1,4-benzoquinol methylase